MVLVTVFAGVCKNDIGLEFTCEILKSVLDRCELGWEIPVPEFVQSNRILRRGSQKLAGPALGFRCALADRAQHYPAEFRTGARFRELQQCPPAADFDVVRVRTEAQHAEPRRCPALESEQSSH